MTPEEFQTIAPSIPHQPGIYKYFDKQKSLIYIGKAKDLRKRVGSYFNKTVVGFKTQRLVEQISYLDFTVVDSEQDALLLENALIKQNKPKFNIILKDDKTYPFIVIKNESFPRIFFTRKKINDGSEYIGPFTSIHMARELMDFIKQFIPLRTCKLNLAKQQIQKGKYKVCLEYHLGNCKGPCEGLQTKDDYDDGIQIIREILKGNMTGIRHLLEEQMSAYAENLAFEQAAMIKKKLDYLEDYQSKSVIVSKHLKDVDVFSMQIENEIAYVNYLKVQNGTVVGIITIKLESRLDETEEDMLVFAITDLRKVYASTSKELILPFDIAYPDESLLVTVPKAGDKKKLLDLSQKNVRYFIEGIQKRKRLHIEEKTEKEKEQVLYQIQHLLQLSDTPFHIECFDNSNFQGSFPVSAMVCFINGEPSKKNYRKFNVKTVEGINDFATMKEAVFRRYKRLIEEETNFPQLVIIDGGKGQLNAALEALAELNLIGKMNIVGLAKNEEELFFPGDSKSIKLDWDSDALKLIRRIRDEVHRFGITFHRNQRSSGTFKNELQNIKGIGANLANELLKVFKSVRNIREKNQEELAAVISKSKAKLVWNYFHENAENGVS